MRGSCQQARLLARMHRREFLQVGSASALGLTASGLFHPPRAGAAPPGDSACIVLWLTGGPSQFDSFDPKPDAPAEIRGAFRPIETSVPGIQVSELFPRLARQARHYALLRSVYHNLDDHARAMCWMLAGRLHDTVKYPTMGSVVARLHRRHPALPAFVTVPRLNPIAGVADVDHSQTAGDLGPAWNPLIPDGVPAAPGFGVRDLSLPPAVTPDRFERRTRILTGVNGTGAVPALPEADLHARAADLVRSSSIRRAFDLDAEPASLRDRYGRHGFGQSTLLARRLVESGVRFVTVNWPSYYQWDHHGGIERAMRNVAPVLDAAAAALFDDLHQRGMLERTLVLCMGEFGRTPKLNKDGGRDHWIQVMSVLAGGAGLRGGQVIGSSTADGHPDERPVHARELVATAYAALGINPNAELPTLGGRPIQVLPEAEPIRELL